MFLTFKVNKIFGHILVLYFYFCWIWLRECVYRIFTVHIFWTNFYWSIFAYNIVLVSVVEQSGSAISIHISPLFLFPSRLSHHRALNRVPELYSRFSLAICFILSVYVCICVYIYNSINSVYVCQSQFSNPFHLPFPPWCPYICSLHLSLYFCFPNKIIYIIFLYSTYMC